MKLYYNELIKNMSDAKISNIVDDTLSMLLREIGRSNPTLIDRNGNTAEYNELYKLRDYIVDRIKELESNLLSDNLKGSNNASSKSNRSDNKKTLNKLVKDKSSPVGRLASAINS